MRILCFILISSLIIGCKSDFKKKDFQVSQIEEVSLLDTLELKLNNGDKWIVNTETHQGVLKMDSIIKDFKLSTQDDYVTLGNSLSKQTSYVIKNCSMKGESHNQLHVVLVPMLDEISILRESNVVSESEESLSKLETLIQKYFTHFKL